ncbi:MAG: phosphoribosylformimino-5-aminoimidazole carboxamide ribotide isomerase [Gammaproteobacteria bacterium]|jgi:phosphoribosylformimino-5-aminoimidazole carboxamide ribotide isomerase
MIIIPEIQLQGGKVVTRSTVGGSTTIHEVDALDLVTQYSEIGAEVIQIVDVDAARSEPENNHALIEKMIASTSTPIQVAGGIRTLSQINDWFEVGAARVVLGTVAITDAQLVIEAANRHPGGIIVHLATRDGYVMIDGWKTQTAFRPEDLIHELMMTGIAGIIHKGTEDINSEDDDEVLALTESMSHDIAIPVYSSGTVKELDDIARLRYIPNINGAIISHALVTGDIKLKDALTIASQQETNPEPETITHNVDMGIHQGVRAYLAAYNTSQATRVWNLALRATIIEDNPYMEILIPQEDLEFESSDLTPRDIQACYERELDRADIVIVVLEGVEAKAWTGFECGYARARGKMIYGITSDHSISGQSEQRFADMCDEIIYFTPGIDFTKSHSEISHSLSTRVMVQQA